MSALYHFRDVSEYLPAFLAALDSGAYAVWLLLSLTHYLTADARHQCIFALMMANLVFIAYSPAWGIIGFFVSSISALLSITCSSGHEEATKMD